ncbi:MBL fold metallo-hydrolase [Aquihabitans sp. G128]|uniref:MBL fold metallo-hydrolase n=1 Tax=Aquihabitans sp. G128 TaxID=2849779 RepID=UPI001C24F3DA|nr:MBL fold metallo-hydrolase [Aquihabitans sp. G128]QXC61782.1 MBL fold metallo-hydrolase [Aquihabitans sp. G128]
MANRMPRPVIRHLPALGITVVSRWIFNCYVVHDGGDGRPFVVDLGLPTQIALVAEVLRLHGSNLSDLGGAVATHGHPDHVGGLPGLRHLAATPIHLPGPLAHLADGSRSIRSPPGCQVARILPVLASQPRDPGTVRDLRTSAKAVGYDAEQVRLPWAPDSWLSDGDHLPGLPDWRVLTTPGHSDDASCLYHAPTRTLLAGDAVLTAGGRAWFNPVHVDLQVADATEARLRALDVENVLPGHGLAASGPRVLADARSHRDRASAPALARSLWTILRDAAAPPLP